MSPASVSYHCQNCGKRFSLPVGEAVRCPSCFWTTSVRRESPEEEPHSAEQKTQSQPKSASPKPAVRGSRSLIIFGAALLVLALFVFRDKIQIPTIIRSRVRAGHPKAVPASKKSSAAQTESSQADPLSLLSVEERTVLSGTVSFSIPRTLTVDEKEILNRRVEISAAGETPPSFKFWTLDEFKEFVTAEQKKRKIYFSWGYERSLAKLFADHYLKAEDAFKKAQYEEARLEFLNALVVPVYANDIRLHRAVALVMLQGYLNEAITKIQRLNSYIFTQALLSSLDQFKTDYADFFKLIGQESWEEALRLLDRLDESARKIESQAKGLEVNYPPVLSQIDPNVRRGLERLGDVLSPLVTNLNSVLTDLKIKRKQVEQNTVQNLQKMKEKYDAAVSALQAKRWQEAESLLEQVAFPPEIAEDAKHKAAILSKLTSRDQPT